MKSVAVEENFKVLVDHIRKYYHRVIYGTTKVEIRSNLGCLLLERGLSTLRELEAWMGIFIDGGTREVFPYGGLLSRAS